MMRDDSMKRSMRAARPSPTPAFSGRLRKTLALLPEPKKQSPLRFLPAAAVVMASAAVVWLAVTYGGTGKLPGNLFASGPEATTEAPTATADESALESTPAPTPSDSTETAASGSEQTLASTPNPEQSPGPAVDPDLQPTPEPTVMPTPEPSAPDSTVAPTPSPNTAIVDGRGKIAFGNEGTVVDIQKSASGDAAAYIIKGKASDQLVDFYLSLKADHGEANAKYPGRQITNNGQNQLIFVLIKGHVDASYITETVGREKLNLLIAANDDAKALGIYIQSINAALSLSDDKKTYELTIKNDNRNYRPESGFTILTVVNESEGKMKYYTLPVIGD